MAGFLSLYTDVERIEVGPEGSGYWVEVKKVLDR